MAGRVYTHRQLVGGADVDPEGWAHLDALVRWQQDAAFADGIDAGLGAESGWVIRRNSLTVERMPQFMERLELRTWCAGLAASTAERRTTIEGDGGAAIEATAIWVHVDVASRRPARFPAHFIAAYEESAAGRRPSTKLHHPKPDPSASRTTWTFTPADVDVAGHVNNAVYWRVLEAALGGSIPRGDAVLEAEYRAGTDAGEAQVARAGGMLWVLGEGGEVAASLSAEPV